LYLVSRFKNAKGFWRCLLFPLLAFLVPLLVRVVPELIMGPYLTGFDTMAHYVPTVLHWQAGNVDLGSFLATAPLLYSIVVLLVSGGGSLILVLKVLSVVLHGFLGLAIFGYARRGIGWGSTKSLAVALLGTLYFVAMRTSWDFLRTEIALIFFFVTLMLFSFQSNFSSSIKRYGLLAVAMVLVVLSEQLIAAILFGVIGLTFLYNLAKKKRLETGRLVAVSLPAVVLFFAVFFLSPNVSEFRLIFGFSQSDGWLALFGFSSYGALLSSAVVFLLFCFLPFLPFVALGFRRLKNLQLYIWVILCTVLTFFPLVSPSNLRWAMLLVYPFAFFVVEGVSRIRRASLRRIAPKLYASSGAFLVLVTCVFSGGFVFFTPELPFAYFSAPISQYTHQIPTSMLQNTVSINDCPDVVDSMQWLNDHMNQSDCLLSHRAFYGWVTYYLNSSQIVLYEYDDPAEVAPNVSFRVDGSVYLVWWVNGQGWYGQSSVSSEFHEVYASGRIAVYQYIE